MVLQAALAALLTKSGAGDDIPLGTPVAGRTDTQLDSLVGFFVNTLVLRTNTSGNPTAGELVESVRYTNLHAYANQDAPFERVVEELNPARSQHRHPLFQVMLTLQNTVPARLAMDGLDASADHGQEPGGAKFDLLLDLAEGHRRDHAASLAYNPALFTPGTAAQLAAGFLAVVEQFAADPAVTLDRLRIQSPEQHARVLDHSLGNHNDGPDGTVVDAFLATAARAPAAPAVVDAAGRSHGLSFSRLQQRVDAAAKGLIALGVEPGDRVAVALPRTADVVTAALAVLAAGAVYIPVDLTYPAERIGMILDDGAPALVIGTPGVAGPAEQRRRPGSGPPPWTHCWPAGRTFRPPTLPRAGQRRRISAYVLYTSGSTGRPKGVAVSHGALANLYCPPPPHPVRPAVRGRRGAPPLRWRTSPGSASTRPGTPCCGWLPARNCTWWTTPCAPMPKRWRRTAGSTASGSWKPRRPTRASSCSAAWPHPTRPPGTGGAAAAADPGRRSGVSRPVGDARRPGGGGLQLLRPHRIHGGFRDRQDRGPGARHRPRHRQHGHPGPGPAPGPGPGRHSRRTVPGRRRNGAGL